ncbi:chromosomal replication initiation protein [Thermotoga sp. Ku-13t]|uniref:chromosomal replication initiator protein DnaA n=1 Tax=Thermotoga sp. Ku-13t TaxID=1755813 RepID=UPI0013EA9EC8|nr:chromosomal replication initiator protein DnaA [Thermotoga sp. Ku-13t]KAF2957995.1 chromosomal replication initiation protein [Thermotoga sp. Ku-13t]
MKEKIIEALKAKLNRRTWDSWFSTFDVKEIGENLVVFEVGNLFIKDWLEMKYGSLIARTLKEVFNRPVEFRIEHAPLHNQPEEDEREPLVRKRPLVLTPLNPIFTFENFVVGPGNMFAYSACLEVAKHPGKYNPLFVYGGVGLGKTHLLQAIGHYLFKHQPEMRVVYLTSERFLNELIEAIQRGTAQEFRERYRTKIDVLLLDDVQFLIGKNGIQTELFHTFNELHNAGKQIVICSDRDPQMLDGFQDRLISRFQMGVVVKIEKPDVETCFKIAQKMVKLEGGDLSDDVLMLIAEKFNDNMRRLKGAIAKLLMHKQIYNEDIDVSKARQILSIEPETVKKPIEEELFEVLSEIFNVTHEELKGNSRKSNVLVARQLGMYVAKNYLGLSLRKIAETFNKSHPTVSNAIERFALNLKNNKSLESALHKVLEHFRGKTANQLM